MQPEAHMKLGKLPSKLAQSNRVVLFWIHGVVMAVLWVFFLSVVQVSFDRSSEAYLSDLIKQPLSVITDGSSRPRTLSLEELSNWADCGPFMSALIRKLVFMSAQTSNASLEAESTIQPLKGQPQLRQSLSPQLLNFANVQYWVRGMQQMSLTETVKGQQSLLPAIISPGVSLDAQTLFRELVRDIDTLQTVDNPNTQVRCSRFEYRPQELNFGLLNSIPFSLRQINLSRWSGAISCSSLTSLLKTGSIGTTSSVIDFLDAPLQGCGRTVLRFLAGPPLLLLDSSISVRQFSGHMCVSENGNQFVVNATSGSDFFLRIEGSAPAGTMHGYVTPGDSDTGGPIAGDTDACPLHTFTYAPPCRVSSIFTANVDGMFSSGGYNPHQYPFSAVQSTPADVVNWQATNLMQRGHLFTPEVLKYAYSIVALNIRTNYYVSTTLLLEQGSAGQVKAVVHTSSTPANNISNGSSIRKAAVSFAIINCVFTCLIHWRLMSLAMVPNQACESVIEGSISLFKLIVTKCRFLAISWFQPQKRRMSMANSRGSYVVNGVNHSDASHIIVPSNASSFKFLIFDLLLFSIETSLFFVSLSKLSTIEREIKTIDASEFDSITQPQQVIKVFSQFYQNFGAVFEVVFIRDSLISYMATTALISGVRLLLQLPARSKLSLLTRLFKQTGSDVFHFLCLFGVVFVTYAVSGVVLFGGKSSGFSTFNSGIVTLLTMTFTGNLMPDSLVASGPNTILPVVFYLSFGLIIVLLLSNVFISILSLGFSQVKEKDVQLRLKPVWFDIYKGLARRANVLFGGVRTRKGQAVVTDCGKNHIPPDIHLSLNAS